MAPEHGPPDYHIAVERHFYSVPYQYVGKEVDVRLRGSVIDVFHRGRQIAGHLRSQAKGRATTLREHQPPGRTSAPASRTPAPGLEQKGPGYRPPCPRLRHRDHGAQPQPGVRLPLLATAFSGWPAATEPERLDAACRYALELGTRTWRGLDNILRTGADRAAAEPELETMPIDHPNIRGPEAYK